MLDNATMAKLVIRVVAEDLHVTVADLIGPRRAQRFIKGRHTAQYLIRVHLHMSLSEIGDLFSLPAGEPRRHSTIQSAVVKVDRQVAQGAMYRAGVLLAEWHEDLMARVQALATTPDSEGAQDA